MAKNRSHGTRSFARLAPLLLILIVTLPLLPPAAVATASPADRERSSSETAVLENPEELESFLDGAVAAQLAAYPVAGMTISVVKDGEPFFAKGYGYADVEADVPVVADETLFRPGSVSKLFVWTAMMQLVEAGKLDLDADVNNYLDFAIPEAFGRPITLRHLMTHTPGFEDQGLGLFLPSAEQMDPLGKYLAENVPRRVFPPGEISAYSNYGASLAGYIVQRVSGLSFDRYVEENIFEPLGMAQSTFRQPLPPELADSLSQGYLYRQGRFEEAIFEFVQSYPAGALSTTATDMARFMIAHLQNGRLGDARILSEGTARQMHELAFAQDPRVPGWGAGFTVGEIDGVRVVGHGGDTNFFHSELLLLPDENVGFFVSTNTDRGTLARFHLMEAFLQRYFVTATTERLAPPDDFAQRAERYTGTYFPARMNFTGIEKILALMQPVQVRVTGEGTLAVTGLLGAEPTYWVERSPDVFAPRSRNLPADAVLLFQPAEEGGEQIEYALFQQSVYIKQPAYASQGFHFALLGLSILFFLAMLVAAPTGALIRRRYRRAAPQAIQRRPPGARLARWVAWLFALLNLTFLIIFFVTVSDLTNVVFGMPPYLQRLLLVPWISVLLTIAIGFFAVRAWLKAYWTSWSRLFYTLFTLVALGYLYFLSFWNFL